MYQITINFCTYLRKLTHYIEKKIVEAKVHNGLGEMSAKHIFENEFKLRLFEFLATSNHMYNAMQLYNKKICAMKFLPI